MEFPSLNTVVNIKLVKFNREFEQLQPIVTQISGTLVSSFTLTLYRDSEVFYLCCY